MEQPKMRAEAALQEPEEETIPQKPEEETAREKLQWKEQQKLHRMRWEEQKIIAEERRKFQQEMAEERIRLREEIARSRREFLQEITEDRRRFERERQGFYLKKDLEEKRLSKESLLFQTKWKILEQELRRLAEEREEIEKNKKRELNRSMGSRSGSSAEYLAEAEIFFSGVQSELEMKKRYRELIKIFHPDNLAGDTRTLQIINRIYDNLKKQFSA